MSKIPYYGADHRLLNLLSESEAERYAKDGTARAVRSKGTIKRLYYRERERVYGSGASAVIAFSHAANGTTERVKDDRGVVIAPPFIRQHRGIGI